MKSTSLGSQLGEQAGQRPLVLDGRPVGHVELDPHFAGEDLRQGRLAETGRAAEQDVIERLAAPSRRLDEHPSSPCACLARRTRRGRAGGTGDRSASRRRFHSERGLALPQARGSRSGGGTSSWSAMGRLASTGTHVQALPRLWCPKQAKSPPSGAGEDPAVAQEERTSAEPRGGTRVD